MEWKWSKANEKSLAQFVSEQAIHKLPKLPESSFDLNQTPENRRQLVETLYNTLITQDIRYAYEKYHPEAETQRIRTPSEILNSPGVGTCLDLALLFCGLCFGYDLLPLLIVIQGHAFAAVSLNHSRREWDSFARDRSLFNTTNLFAGDENLAELQQLIDSGAYIAVECTGFARTQSFSGSEPEATGRTDEGILTFDRAVAAGREQLNNPQRPFQFAIDIAVARYSWKIDFIGQQKRENRGGLTRQEYRNRQALLAKVKHYWVKGVLEKSLNNQVSIELGLEERPDAIVNPWSEILEIADSSPQPLPEGTRVIDFFDRMGEGRTLLILGEPGSGKTTTLLELARDLIDCADRDSNLRIPVVFNLSSWADKRQTIKDWLVDELGTKYDVPNITRELLVKQQKILPLLDGLDEVKAEYQNDCIAELNQFKQDYDADLVVCSRIQDYKELSNSLSFQSAIYIQLLTLEKIDRYLNSVGTRLVGLRRLIQEDRVLQELAQSPLMLNIMTLAYQGVPAEELPKTEVVEERRKKLFNDYIEAIFHRHNRSKDKQIYGQKIYAEVQTKRWLIWLAQNMKKDSKTLFLIEQMQPTLLHKNQKLYKIVTFLISIFTFYFVLKITPIKQNSKKNIENYYGGKFVSKAQTILIILSASSFLINMLIKLIIDGVLSHSITYFILFPYAIFIILFISNNIRVLKMGSSRKMLRRILNNLPQHKSRIDSTPNEGIFNSFKSATVAFFGCFLIFEFVYWLLYYFSNLIYNYFDISIFNIFINNEFLNHYFVLFILVFFLIQIMLLSGGRACIQHFTLRLILWRNNSIPWNYARFLDYAADRIFLQKVGGGYIFIHRMLMEHFAQMGRE